MVVCVCRFHVSRRWPGWGSQQWRLYNTL